MFEKFKDINKYRKAQSEMKKQLEQIFVTLEKQGNKVVIRGDKRIEKLEINGQEDKSLRDLINEAMKEMDKKMEKTMRSRTDILKELGIPGM